MPPDLTPLLTKTITDMTPEQANACRAFVIGNIHNATILNVGHHDNGWGWVHFTHSNTQQLGIFAAPTPWHCINTTVVQSGHHLVDLLKTTAAIMKAGNQNPSMAGHRLDDLYCPVDPDITNKGFMLLTAFQSPMTLQFQALEYTIFNTEQGRYVLPLPFDTDEYHRFRLDITKPTLPHVPLIINSSIIHWHSWNGYPIRVD